MYLTSKAEHIARYCYTNIHSPNVCNSSLVCAATGGSIGSASTSSVPAAPSTGSGTGVGGDLSLNLRGSSRGTSAPSSPAKSRESLLQRVQSLTGAARDQGANLLGRYRCDYHIIIMVLGCHDLGNAELVHPSGRKTSKESLA